MEKRNNITTNSIRVDRLYSGLEIDVSNISNLIYDFESSDHNHNAKYDLLIRVICSISGRADARTVECLQNIIKSGLGEPIFENISQKCRKFGKNVFKVKS